MSHFVIPRETVRSAWFAGISLRPVNIAALLLAFLPFISGCSIREKPETCWAHRHTGYGVPTYRNFYEHYEEYPDYGIAAYDIDEERGDVNDPRHVKDALRLCRAHFGAAYRSRELTYFNGFKDIPFTIRFVVVTIDNRAAYREDRSRAEPFQVGYVFSAAEVFAGKVDYDRLLKMAYIIHNPVWEEPLTEEEKKNGYSPGGKTRYPVIEEHMKANPPGNPDEGARDD